MAVWGVAVWCMCGGRARERESEAQARDGWLGSSDHQARGSARNKTEREDGQEEEDSREEDSREERTLMYMVCVSWERSFVFERVTLTVTCISPSCDATAHPTPKRTSHTHATSQHALINHHSSHLLPLHKGVQVAAKVLRSLSFLQIQLCVGTGYACECKHNKPESIEGLSLRECKSLSTGNTCMSLNTASRSSREKKSISASAASQATTSDGSCSTRYSKALAACAYPLALPTTAHVISQLTHTHTSQNACH